ncbi:DUF927 domain-containing protein [Bacillus seohaeanensis]|jgi:putative DNA primase/helicase|uniref:DUF927 domain-containing protein n=1 Tax=Bacillus seohaeanensis TaxID=284580 RepID=A0ABW5RL77_9BACI
MSHSQKAEIDLDIMQETDEFYQEENYSNSRFPSTSRRRKKITDFDEMDLDNLEMIDDEFGQEIETEQLDVEVQEIKDVPLVQKSEKYRRSDTSSNKYVKSYIPKGNYGFFRVKGSTLYTVDKKDDGTEKEILLGNLVYIKEVIERTDEKEIHVFLVLRYWFHSQWYEVTIGREQLQVNELSKLMSTGMDVPSHKAKRVAIFLSYQESEAPKRYEHIHLGWKVDESMENYKHQNIIGNSIKPSRYGGDFSLQKGDLSGWINVVNNEVIGHTPLEFALVAGLSSPLVSWVARDFDMEVLVIHAYGDTSKGKTTAARVFVSPFGRPARKDGGLILLWKATQNAIIAQISNNHGIPLALDEASMNRLKDFTEMIYLLAEGKEKARMTKDIKLRDQRTWSGTFFSTAEHSLLMKSNQNGGLLIRLQEFGNVSWTKDGDHAERLRRGLLQHYGEAGPIFVKFIAKKGKDTVYHLVSQWSERCLEKMEIQNGLSQRLAQKYGLLMATAELANECFDFTIDLDDLLDFLIQHQQSVALEGDYSERAYASFKQLVIQHRTKFARDSEPPIAHETWGKIFTKGNGIEVAILKEIFREEMIKKGFENPQQILSKWKSKGLLDTEASKLTKKKTIPGTVKRDIFLVRFEENFLNVVENPIVRHWRKQGDFIQTTEEEVNDIGDLG